MRQHSNLTLRLSWLRTSGPLFVLLVALAYFAVPNESMANCSIDQGGKYFNKVYTLLVPEDRADYGDCYDYGFWEGGTYANHTGIPEGFWVYAYPYWYVWAEDLEAAGKQPADCSNSQGGKYSGLLHELYLPADLEDFGSCNDWGYWSGNSYGGYTGLEPGYWVYAYPYWYIWSRER